MMDNSFIGLNGFVWWIGIVEDRQDPLKLGRCRVRIFGWHTENKLELPTNDLPWAQAMLPLNDTNPYSPKEADTIVGFFMDGQNAQIPIMMGVLPGIPLDPADPSKGFNDPRTNFVTQPIKYGQSSTGYPRTLDEPTTTRLARGDSDFTPEQITQLENNKAIFEQNPSYNAKYPYNKVIESEAGHALELDDTPNYERVHLYHKNGSNLEMRPDGSVQQKVMLNHTRNILGDDINYIKGNSIYFIDGDLTYIVKGKITFVSDGDFTGISKKSITFNASSNFSASATLSASLSGTISSSLGGLLSAFTSVDGVKTDVSAIGVLTCSGTGSATYGAGGLNTVSGATINLVNVPTPGGSSESPPAPTTAGGATDAVAGVDFKINAEGFPEAPFASGGIVTDATGRQVSSVTYAAEASAVVDAAQWTFNPEVARAAAGNAIIPDPTFLDKTIKVGQSAVDEAFAWGATLPDKAKNAIGWNSVVDSGSAVYKDASVLVTGIPTIDGAKKLVNSTTEFVGNLGKAFNSYQSLNALQLATQDYTKGVCTLAALKNKTKELTQDMIDKKNEFLNAIKDDRDKLREQIDNISDDYKNKLKDLESKALQEWIDTHKYDEDCGLCAQEAESRLRSNAAEKDVRNGLNDCLHRQAEAQINRYKTNVPITDASIVKTQKDICGTPEVKINTGA